MMWIETSDDLKSDRAEEYIACRRIPSVSKLIYVSLVIYVKEMNLNFHLLSVLPYLN